MKHRLAAALTVTFMAVAIFWLTAAGSKPLAAQESGPTLASIPNRTTSGNAAFQGPETENSTPGHLSPVSQEAGTVIFLPVISNDVCSSTFSFNEFIPYNLAAINAETAWACYQGQGITIAIVDSGVDLDHPDLQGNLVAGQTFISGTSSPDDDDGHGSHVAGIAAAVANNGSIIGVAPRANIMPVKVLNSSGSGSASGVANGIIWAADNGAHIINLSLGTSVNSSTISAAVDYAHSKGVLVVAAAGNCGDSSYIFNGCSFQDQPWYPAALTQVIAVAATDQSNNQASFSTAGDYVEMAAPGSSIQSTYANGGYATLSGTSQASPHVAGVAALIWSQNPSFTNEGVRSQIRNTALDLGTTGWDSEFGFGLVDAAGALGLLQTTSLPAQSPPASTSSSTDAPYVSGEVLFKLQDEAAMDQMVNALDLEGLQVRVADQIPQIGAQQLSVSEGLEKMLVEKLRTLNKVVYAELNYVVTKR